MRSDSLAHFDSGALNSGPVQSKRMSQHLRLSAATGVLRQGFSFEIATPSRNICIHIAYQLLLAIITSQSNQSSQNVLLFSLTSSSFCSNGAVSDSDDCRFRLLHM